MREGETREQFKEEVDAFVKGLKKKHLTPLANAALVREAIRTGAKSKEEFDALGVPPLFRDDIEAFVLARTEKVAQEPEHVQSGIAEPEGDEDSDDAPASEEDILLWKQMKEELAAFQQKTGAVGPNTAEGAIKTGPDSKIIEVDKEPKKEPTLDRDSEKDKDSKKDGEPKPDTDTKKDADKKPEPPATKDAHHASAEHHDNHGHGHGEPWHVPRSPREWGWLGAAMGVGLWEAAKFLKNIGMSLTHSIGYIISGDAKHPWSTIVSNIKSVFAKGLSLKGGGGGHKSGGHDSGHGGGHGGGHH